MSVAIARTVDDVVAAMAGGARPIAGGSDLVVGARHGSPLPAELVAIDRVAELAGIDADETRVRIGATTTHAQLLSDDIVTGRLPGLADAAALIGSPATRNVGTIGGNIMNASPAADTSGPLLALGASIELRSATGARSIPITELWVGPGTTSADPTELCTAILVPNPAPGQASAYVRLEYRRAMEIAVVGAAASVTVDADGALAQISVALTAVAPTVVALDGESLAGVLGRPVAEAAAAAADLARSTAAPISDLRAGADYRRHVVGVLVERAVLAAADRARGESVAIPLNRSRGVGR